VLSNVANKTSSEKSHVCPKRHLCVCVRVFRYKSSFWGRHTDIKKALENSPETEVWA
jgi:hypothetical protein